MSGVVNYRITRAGRHAKRRALLTQAYDGVIVGIVALVFAFIVNVLRHLGPQWDGLYVVPAIVGAAFRGASLPSP